MKKLIDEEIRQRVDVEMKKLGKSSKDEVATSVMKAVSRKLFTSPKKGDEGEDDANDVKDDEATRFRKMIQKTFEADELRKQDEALKKKKKEWFDEQQRVKKLEDEIQRLEREKQRIPQLQLFSQGEDDVPKEHEKDELHAWYEKSEKRGEGDSKSSGSKDKDDELSTKEMLKILTQSQERTMEIALKAKDEKDEDELKLKKERERDWTEDQRMKVVDLKELPSQFDRNAAVKCGDWIHRITPTNSNLSRKASTY